MKVDDLWTKGIEYAKLQGRLEGLQEEVNILRAKIDEIRARMYELNSSIEEERNKNEH